MALLWFDGFELYNGFTSAANFNGWIPNLGTNTARTGRGGYGGSMYKSPGGDWTMRRAPGGTFTRLIQGVAFELILTPGSNAPVALVVFDGTTQQFGVRVVVVGAGYGVAVYRNATLIATSALLPQIVIGAYCYIELDVTIHNSTGAYEVRVDEVAVLSASGVDTANTANNYATGFGFIGGQGNSAFDDYYCCDTTGSNYNTFLGDVRVETLMPTSNSSVQWTPSTGTNYQTVDETTLSAADYNESSTVGHIDKFGLQDLTTTPTTVHAVAPIMNQAKVDAGGRTIRNILDSGGTVRNGASVSPTLTTPLYTTDIVMLNPNGSVAWTGTSVNALLAGYEIVT